MMLNINEVISARYAWATQNRQTDRLRALMRTGGCHVYAAGRYGRQVAAALRAGGYPVRGFIDANSSDGQEVEGTVCRRPEDVDIAEASRAVLIIAINNFRTPVDDVCTWGEHLGFADVVFVPELPDLLGRHLGNYWQASRRDIFENAPAIARLDALLGDARSREILAQLVSYRISGRPEDHPTVDRERQYFPADMPLPTRDIAVIDCGAYPGDLLETALKAGKTLSHWYAFEPDPKNFGELCAFVNDRSDWVEEAVLFPCGVGDTVGTMCFATGDADASRAVIEATDSAETQILPIVRVDDVLKPGRLDMVKLDIEGFEAAALDGMAGLLDRYRPRLAMAVYHKPADLWELPFRVDKMMPGGRYALRQHGYNGYDTVLYVDWR